MFNWSLKCCKWNDWKVRHHVRMLNASISPLVFLVQWRLVIDMWNIWFWNGDAAANMFQKLNSTCNLGETHVFRISNLQFPVDRPSHDRYVFCSQRTIGAKKTQRKKIFVLMKIAHSWNRIHHVTCPFPFARHTSWYGNIRTGATFARTSKTHSPLPNEARQLCRTSAFTSIIQRATTPLGFKNFGHVR